MLRNSWLGIAVTASVLALGCGDDGSSSGSATETGGETGGESTTDGMTSSPTSTATATTTTGSSTTDDPSTTTTDPSTTGDPTTTGDSTGGTGSSGATVSGNFSRSVDPGGSNDGVGDAYLGLLVACNQNAESIASTTVLDADLSMDGAIVPFAIEDVPDGTYYLTGFFDDNQNTDPLDPGPDLNDLASAMGLGPQCTEVTVTGGADVTGVVLTFNFVVPF